MIYADYMREYFIREADSEEAKGPYDPGRLADLLEAGKISGDTLYFNEDNEEWLPIKDNEALFQLLFPEKKKYTLKEKSVDNALNRDSAEGVPVRIEDMLAAAEGKTEETEHLVRSEKLRGRAAGLCLPILAVITLLSAASVLLPEFSFISEVLEEKNYASILSRPMILLGLFDLFLFICCVLAATDAFPLIRFRFMLGLGYFGYAGWSWGENHPTMAVIAGCIGAFVCTLTLNFPLMVLCGILGIGGMGAYAFFSIF